MATGNFTPPLGWYVRVFTTERVEGAPLTKLYLAGYPGADQAVEAVKRLRAISGEEYQAVATAIPGRGPQPGPGEVRELKGAI
jgi:hypothetical protein